MAKASKAQLMALAKFKQEKRDTLTIDLPKGTKDEYKQSAARLGTSLTKLIQVGVEEYITNHGGEVMTVKPENQLSAEERKLIDEFNQLPTDARKSLMKFLKAVNTKGGGENGND